MLEEKEFKKDSISDLKVDDNQEKNSERSELLNENLENVIFENTEQSAKIAAFKPINFSSYNEGLTHEDSFKLTSGKTDLEKIKISEGFKTTEFFHENSLLTNAEDYANSIREGANLYKTELLSKIEQQANDTESIRRKIISEKKEAELEREELLSSTKVKVEEIKKEAFKEGYDDGHKMGIQKRYDESEPLVSQVNSVLEQLSSLRKILRFKVEKELVKLALQIAKNVVADEIKLHNSVIENIVKVSLKKTEMEGKICLSLNPDDYEFLLKSKCDLEKYLSEEQSLFIRQKSEIDSGSIIVESDGIVINRSVENQFIKIENILNEQIEKREASLSEGEIDSNDFSLNQVSESGKSENESKNSLNLQMEKDNLSNEGNDLEKEMEKENIKTSVNSGEENISEENDNLVQEKILEESTIINQDTS